MKLNISQLYFEYLGDMLFNPLDQDNTEIICTEVFTLLNYNQIAHAGILNSSYLAISQPNNVNRKDINGLIISQCMLSLFGTNISFLPPQSLISFICIN